MKYIAKTYDARGKIIEVEISVGTSAGQTEVGSDGLYLAADEAVTITGETNDTFDTLLPQSASIRLVTDRFLPDLFQGDCRNAPVTIKVDDSTIWRGFVAPMNYTQQWVSNCDDLSVDCIDWAAALQYVRYKGCVTPEDYESASGACSERTLKAIFEECVALVTDMPVNYRGVPMMSTGTLDALEGLTVNDRLFIGDSIDDVWTAQQICETILKYLNLHATQRNGQIEVYPWEVSKQSTDVYTIGSGNTYGDSHTISVTEMFNRIAVRVSMDELEELIPDILDSETLTSRFASDQMYCTEYSLKKSGDGYDGLMPAYISMIAGFAPQTNKDAELSKRTWWMRAMRSKNWKCYKSGAKWDFSLPLGTSRDQYLFDGQFPSGAAAWSGMTWSDSTWQNTRLDLLLADTGSAIVDLYTANETYSGGDNSPVASREEEKAVIIGVAGQFAGNAETKPTDAQVESMRTRMLNAIPRLAYEGESAALSPVDDLTTRYILISGKVGLAPVLLGGGPPTALNDEARLVAQGQGDVFLAASLCGNSQKTGEDGERYFNRYWYKAEYPSDFAAANTYCNGAHALAGQLDTVIGDWQIKEHIMFSPMGDESPRYFKFEKARKSDGTMTKLDLVNKVGVLSCMLIVGDKCVVEVGDGSRPEHYVWRTFKKRSECADDEEFLSQSFTIGVNPKIGDHIIGQRYDINNTVHYSYGIDGEGIAIPVRRSDNVSGAVTFIVLGPTEMMWDTGTVRWLTLNGMAQKESAEESLLPYVSHVDLFDLSVTVKSDNGGDDPLNDSDLIYLSDTDETYVHEKKEIEMEICSALTTEERRTFGTRDTRCLATVTDTTTGLGVLAVKDPRSGEVAKPEQFYVDRAWREVHSPKIEIEHGVRTDKIPADMLSAYKHQALSGKTFFPLAITRDLQTCSASIRIREI